MNQVKSDKTGIVKKYCRKRMPVEFDQDLIVVE